MFHKRVRGLPATTLAVLFAAISSAPNSLTGQQTGALDLSLAIVSATPTCSATVDAVSWGQFDAGTFVNTNGPMVPFNLDFNCTGAVAAATATFDGGQNPGAGSALRRLSNGSGNIVDYGLLDANSLSVFAGAAVTFPLPVGPQSVPFTAFLKQQALPLTVGAYTDQVTVTFTF